MKYKVLSHSLFAAALLMTLACSKEDIDAGSNKMSIRCKFDRIEATKATLVTSDNVAAQHPTMMAYVVSTSTKTQAFPTEEFATADAATSLTLQNSVWKEGEYALFSYPKNTISPEMENGKLKLTDGKMKFNYTISTNSTDTPDIIVAATKAKKEDGIIALGYKHIFTAVNVIYADPKVGHRVSSIKVKNAYTKGTCTVGMDGSIVWSNQDEPADLVDSNLRGVSYGGQVITEDGYKFMVIPEKSEDDRKISIEVVVDGKTLTATSDKISGAGDIVNFSIKDDLTITPTGGVSSEGKVEKNDDGTYKITLESYVTGEMRKVVKPADFVLILDYSGTMDAKYGNGQDYYEATRVPYTYYDWNKQGKKTFTWDGVNYDIKVATTKNTDFASSDLHWAYIEKGGKRFYLTPRGSVVECATVPTNSDKYLVGVNGEIIEPSEGNGRSSSGGAITARGTLWSTINYSSVQATNRFTALKSAVSLFIDKVQQNANENNVVHRIGIVKFAGDSYPKFGGSDGDMNNYANPSYSSFTKLNYFLKEDRVDLRSSSTDTDAQKTSVLSRMSAVSSQNSVDVLKASLTNINYGGSTATDRGIKLGKVLMDYQGRTDPDVQKVAIVFSDGRPQNKGGASTSTEMENDANSAVAEAKKLKDAGYTVYTIGLFSSSEKENSNKIMQAISSNYPLATTYKSPGTQADSKYFKDATETDLSEVFTQIFDESMEGEPDIDLPAESYVLSIISDAFTLPEGYFEADPSNLRFYKVGQKSFNTESKVITWNDSMTDMSGVITCESPGKQTFSIMGFDYGANFCGKGRDGIGNKLVMIFDNLPPNEERAGSGLNQAIVFTTGLYDKDGNPISYYDPATITVYYD